MSKYTSGGVGQYVGESSLGRACSATCRAPMHVCARVRTCMHMHVYGDLLGDDARLLEQIVRDSGVVELSGGAPEVELDELPCQVRR